MIRYFPFLFILSFFISFLAQANDTCEVCKKTIYPTEEITISGTHFHKSCLKCTKCGKQLNLNTALISPTDKKPYCKDHLPVIAAVSTAASVSIKSAVNAPKKTSEGSGTAQKQNK
jgi:hypothetical protein